MWSETSSFEVEAPDGRVKYPRTFHLPWSPGATSDDKILQTTDHFNGREVAITEKLDGENTTIYQDGLHARSLDAGYHPTRTWVNKIQGEIGYQIPPGWRICGENLQGVHSLSYENLPSYFLVFSVWDENNLCLSWDDTLEICQMLGLHTVPLIYRGPWDENAIRSMEMPPTYSNESEGYVVRITDSFPFEAFQDSVAKFVRADHVQTTDHWLEQEPAYNKLGFLENRPLYDDLSAQERKIYKNKAKGLNIRAIKVNAEGRVSGRDLYNLIEQHNSQCFYCKTPLDYDTPMPGHDANPATFDHYKPLLTGGRGSVENIVPACSNCNQDKNTYDQWIPKQALNYWALFKFVSRPDKLLIGENTYHLALLQAEEESDRFPMDTVAIGTGIVKENEVVDVGFDYGDQEGRNHALRQIAEWAEKQGYLLGDNVHKQMVHMAAAKTWPGLEPPTEPGGTFDLKKSWPFVYFDGKVYWGDNHLHIIMHLPGIEGHDLEALGGVFGWLIQEGDHKNVFMQTDIMKQYQDVGQADNAVEVLR